MLVPSSTWIRSAGRASCTSSGALPLMLVAAAGCSVRLGRGTFGGPDTGPIFCAICMFGPTSGTCSGVVPILAAAWSCERFGFSIGLSILDGSMLGPGFCAICNGQT